jgi:hypothetical protein
MKDILDKNKLEKILLTNWAEFINIRKLIEFTRESCIKHLQLPETIQVFEIRVSRFEPTQKGFLLWLETTLNSTDIITTSTETIKPTLEVFLNLSGEAECLNIV